MPERLGEHNEAVGWSESPFWKEHKYEVARKFMLVERLMIAVVVDKHDVDEAREQFEIQTSW